MKTVFAISLFLGCAVAHRRSHRKLVSPRDRSAIIDDQFILVFDDSVEDVDAKVKSMMGDNPGCSVLYTYKDDIKGVSVKNFDDVQLWNMLDDPQVLFAEEVRPEPINCHVVHFASIGKAISSLTNCFGFLFDSQDQVVRAIANQADPTWGLDRIDEQQRPLDDNYRYDYTGEGVTAFVVDTGILTSHQDFGGRATCGFSAFRFGGCRDSQGHGTHVAGTVGSSTYGVAKNVDIVAVKVLNANGEGSTSGVIAGIEYIRQQKQRNPSKPMVANMSLGGGESPALDAAVNNAVAAGVVFAVAAGNSDIDACFSSPASAGRAIAVASSNFRDSRSSFSNYGSCVDIFAPGESITSLWSSSTRAINTISGTSMASPHVAGVAALILEENPSWSPNQVWDAMRADAVAGVISNPGRNSPNLLLNAPLRADGGGSDIDGGDGGEDGEQNDVEDVEEDPVPQCRRLFSSCRSGSDCCSDSCRFRLCFFV